MLEKVEKIWMNGEYKNWDEAQVHILTHTLHYGMGVFEGIRCYEQHDGTSAIFRLPEHIKRLHESAHMFLMKIPYSIEEISKVCIEIFKINKLKGGYLRPIAYLGYGGMGINASTLPVDVAIAAWPWGAYLGEEGVKNGIRAKIASFNRLAVNVNLPKSKACGNYLNSILCKREAIMAGYEEALVLDTDGYVAEATGENVFIVKDGVVTTPPESSSILNGITRDTVIKILKDEGIPVREQRMVRDDTYIADEIFLTGTAAEITPIRELDDRQIGTGKPGPITQKIQQIYFDTIRGKVDKYKEWLTTFKV
jgi:branched-chain amino acid aminotransferase